MLSRPSYNNIILCLCTYLFSRRPAECYIDWRTVVKRRSGRIVRRLIDRVVRWGYSKREKHKRFREQIRRIKRDKKKKVTASGGGNIRPARASLCFRLMDWNKKRRWQLHSGAIDLFFVFPPLPPPPESLIYILCRCCVAVRINLTKKEREKKNATRQRACNIRKGSETGIRTDSGGDTCQRSLQTIDKHVRTPNSSRTQSFQTSDLSDPALKNHGRGETKGL